MVSRLKRLTPPAVVDGAVRTSGRRWRRRGFWSQAVLNQMVILGYIFGVDPHTLAKWYR